MIVVCLAMLSMRGLDGHKTKLPGHLIPMILATSSISSITHSKGEPSICNSLTELTALSTEHGQNDARKPGLLGAVTHAET